MGDKRRKSQAQRLRAGLKTWNWRQGCAGLFIQVFNPALKSAAGQAFGGACCLDPGCQTLDARHFPRPARGPYV
jgi:hypothetical protein